MPKLSEISQATRIQQALEVLALMSANSKLTQEAACKQVGISPKVYRFWIAQSQEAIGEFQDLLGQLERSELARILVAREAILERVIADGMARFTEPGVRMGIHKYLSEMADTLSDRHRSIDSGLAADLLSGPEQIPGESRFAATVAVSPQPDGSVNIKLQSPPVVDSKLSDNPPRLPAQSSPDRLDPQDPE